MLKINLSNEEDGEEKPSPDTADTAVHEAAETTTGTAETDSDASDQPKEKKKRRPISKREIVLIVLLCVTALAYYQKDMIFGLFSGGEEIAPVVEAPVQPLPEPEPEPELLAPDPAIVALSGIQGVVPERAWLTSAHILYDGTYEINGMAFTHDSALQLIAMLGKIGTVGTHNIPKKQKSSETVYPFTVSGKMNDVMVPEILDNIPSDRLVPLAESVSIDAKERGVKFLRLPQAGQVYTNDDLPFALEGSFDDLQDIISTLCPDDGNTRIYRLKINPARPGKGYNTIQASFSLKTVSAI